MSHFPKHGILRNTNRNSRQAARGSGLEEVYSHERSISYHSDPANMPIFAEDEDPIQRIDSKSQNINANLYAQALAAKSSLGLLDGRNSSALEALCSYDSFVESPGTTPEKKRNSHPHSSMLSKSSYKQTSGSHASYDDLEDDLSPYKYTETHQIMDTDQPVSFKPLTDLNLNTVDDEDEFLYGDSNPSPSENSPFQNQTTSKISNKTYSSDGLVDIGTPPVFERYQKSFQFSESKESNADGKPGTKLSISSFKKRSSWNYTDDPIVDSRFAKKELSKHYKESFDSYSNNPSALNEASYDPHSYLHYNLDEQSRPFKMAKENSMNFAELGSLDLKMNNSSLNQSVSAEDSSNIYEDAIHRLRQQLNFSKSAKNNIQYDEEFYKKYDEPQNERRVIYDGEKKPVDKSSPNETLKFPKLLINVQQGESSPSKRVVQVKESNIPSSKYNASVAKSENSLAQARGFVKGENMKLDDAYEPDESETLRVVRNKGKASQEPANVSSKGETRVLPKRYSEKSQKKNDESSVKQRPTEKLPKKYSDKYHYVKDGMESLYGYGSKSKSHRLRSPERRHSPSLRYRSPSYSPKRWSPEPYRRRSPSYSPPSSRARNRSPSQYYRDHSPSYRSRDSRRRSSERSSRRERRSHERSPLGRSRHRSRGRSPSWSAVEKERGRSPSWSAVEKEAHLSHDSSSAPKFESKKKERTVIKRGRNVISEEKSDEEQEVSFANLSDKLKGKEPEVLKESGSLKFDINLSKKRKITVTEENKDTIQKSQHSDAVAKITHGLGIIKSTSNPPAEKEKEPEITQDSSNSKEKRSEMMNSLLNRLGIGLSTSTITSTVEPTMSWSTGPTDSLASVAATPQQLNIQQYGMQQPQQPVSSVPQMYAQYMYRPAMPPAPRFPPFNTPPPPIYPALPISSTSTFTYPPPAVPPVANTYNPINFQISNPNSKGRISCLKSIPFVNSNQPVPQPSVAWNQNIPLSPVQYKSPDASNTLMKGALYKNLASIPAETNNSSAETEQSLVDKYKKLREEMGTLNKKLKSTADHTLEIRNLQTKLMEQKSKSPKNSALKQLNTKCSNLYEKINEELKRYIDDVKHAREQLQELKTKIKPETLNKIEKEIPEKKLSLSVKYSGFDSGNHWCESCNQVITSIPKMMEHLHSEMHIKHEDPLKVIANEAPKESYEKTKLLPVKGVEFIKPAYTFYCSLCDEILSNPSYAEYHLKGSSHIEKYMNFISENPIYERKRDMFKEVASVALANDKKLKSLEEKNRAKQLAQETKLEIKRQDKKAALKLIADKLQELKEHEKDYAELEESNSNARMSPQNQKGSLKLTLLNEKGKTIEPLEPSAAKVPDVKPKTKVVYIGRAPNYKPKPKAPKKQSSSSSEIKNADIYVKDEEENPITSNVDQNTVSEFGTVSADEKIKNVKNIYGSIESNKKNQTASPKRIKSIPGCQSEAEAKESELASDGSDKHSFKSSDMPTDNSEINQAIKNFIRSRKNATPVKVKDNLSNEKMSESPSNAPSALISSPKVSPSNNTQSALKSSPRISSPLPESGAKFSPLSKSSPQHAVSSPLRKEKHMSEEERDFLLLGISKSDMEPLAIPRPPPSNLIHNHSEAVSKFQSFPPVQIPPPNIISNVPPPNITSQVPPPNIISNVPPPNIISNVPPPNIVAQVPPPTLVMQWSSEQKQASNLAFSDNNIPSHSNQFTTSTVDENTGIMDMEIDNDLVCSEIKVGSEVSSAPKESSILSEPVKNEAAPSLLSPHELCAENSEEQVPVSGMVVKDEDRLVLNILGSLMDSVSETVEDLNIKKSSIETISESLSLSPNKTNEDSSDCKLSLSSSNFELSTKNIEENSIVGENKKDTQKCTELLTVSSEVAVQYDKNGKTCINEPLTKNVLQDVCKEDKSNMETDVMEVEVSVNDEKKIINVTLTSTSEEFCDENEPLTEDMIQSVSKEDKSKMKTGVMEVEEVSVNEEKKSVNVTLTSTSTKEFCDEKEVEKKLTSSDESFKLEACEFLEQNNKIPVSSSSEVRTSLTIDNEKESKSLSLNANIDSRINSSSLDNASSCDKNLSEKKENVELEDQLTVEKIPASSIIKTEAKEEINEPIETLQLEKLSCKQSTGT